MMEYMIRPKFQIEVNHGEWYPIGKLFYKEENAIMEMIRQKNETNLIYRVVNKEEI